MFNLKEQWMKVPESYRLEAPSLLWTFIAAMLAQLAYQVGANQAFLSVGSFSWAVINSMLSAAIRAGVKATGQAFIAWNATKK